MNWKLAILPGLLVLPLLLVLAAGFGTDPHAVPSVLQGKPAPSFKLSTMSGEQISSESLRGKPALLNFWSTWCEPCKVEHELLQQGAQLYGDSIQFVGIVYQDEEETVRQFLARRTDTYPQVFDPTSRTAIEYGVTGVPESFFIDADGTIFHKEAGVLSPTLLRTKLSELLARASGGAAP